MEANFHFSMQNGIIYYQGRVSKKIAYTFLFVVFSLCVIPLIVFFFLLV